MPPTFLVLLLASFEQRPCPLMATSIMRSNEFSVVQSPALTPNRTPLRWGTTGNTEHLENLQTQSRSQPAGRVTWEESLWWQQQLFRTTLQHTGEYTKARTGLLWGTCWDCLQEKEMCQYCRTPEQKSVRMNEADPKWWKGEKRVTSSTSITWSVPGNTHQTDPELG